MCSIASIASTDPTANALPLIPVSKKAHTADDLESHVASDLGEAIDEIIYKVTLERWNSNRLLALVRPVVRLHTGILIGLSGIASLLMAVAVTVVLTYLT